MTDLKNKKTVEKSKPLLRKGDTSWGKPVGKALKITEIEIPNNPDENIDIDFYEKLNKEEFSDDNNAFSEGLMKIKKKILLIVAVFIFIVFYLIFKEGVRTYFTLKTLPIFIQIPYVLLLTIIFGFIFVLMLKVFFLYLNLKSSSGIKVVKRLSVEQKEKKREAFVDYMSDYVSNNNLGKKDLCEKEVDALKSAYEYLSNPNIGTTEDFYEEYQEMFQSVLDKKANHIILKNIKLVGFKTAIAPGKFLDMMIVLYYSIKMIKELMLIYNLRVSNSDAVFIFLFVVSNVYFVAGNLEDITEDATSGIISASAEAVPNLIASFSEKVLAKGAEGAVNAVFLNRIGKKTKALLQPYSVK